MFDPAIYRAPSVDALAHSNIRLDCDPAIIRDLWRADTRKDVLAVLVRHFDGDEGKAYDLFHTTQWDNGLRPLSSVKRELIATVGGFHGVEYLGVNRRTGKGVRYCNAGETYAPTLIFHGRTLSVGCWGDLIERRIVRAEEF